MLYFAISNLKMLAIIKWLWKVHFLTFAKTVIFHNMSKNGRTLIVFQFTRFLRIWLVCYIVWTSPSPYLFGGLIFLKDNKMGRVSRFSWIFWQYNPFTQQVFRLCSLCTAFDTKDCHYFESISAWCCLWRYFL